MRRRCSASLRTQLLRALLRRLPSSRCRSQGTQGMRRACSSSSSSARRPSHGSLRGSLRGGRRQRAPARSRPARRHSHQRAFRRRVPGSSSGGLRSTMGGQGLSGGRHLVLAAAPPRGQPRGTAAGARVRRQPPLPPQLRPRPVLAGALLEEVAVLSGGRRPRQRRRRLPPPSLLPPRLRAAGAPEGLRPPPSARSTRPSLRASTS